MAELPDDANARYRRAAVRIELTLSAWLAKVMTGAVITLAWVAYALLRFAGST